MAGKRMSAHLNSTPKGSGSPSTPAQGPHSRSQTVEQRRTVAELGAEVRSVDAFDNLHVKLPDGRLSRINRAGMYWDFDRSSRGLWIRPAWAWTDSGKEGR